MRGMFAEELERFLAGHLQHVGDGLAFVVDFERLAVVALAVADFARHVDVRQEVHLDLDDAVALTVLAAAALDVEAEAAGLVAAKFRFGQSAKSRIGVNRPVYVAGLERGVRPIGDWSMSMTLSTCVRAVDSSCCAGRVCAPVQMALRAHSEQDLVDERAILPGPIRR